MFDINKKIDELAACKPARKKKRRRALSLHEEVLSLVQNANLQVADERCIAPRSALTVMNRALVDLASLSDNSKRLGVIREVNRFISLQHDTYKAHTEITKYGDLLPIGHPLCSLNYTQDAGTVRRYYSAWLAADSSVPSHLKALVSSAFASSPLSLERKHAFMRLNISSDAAVPLFFKIDPIVAAFTFRGGNSSAARRARVALQWRDRRGRWVEMGRGLDFNFRLPDGSIGSAGGTYVGVNAERGYSTENGKPVGNAGLVEVRGNANIPDGIYSIESANASPVKARVPGEALRRAKVRATPSVRKPTAEEAQSKDIPNLEDLLNTRVDSPSGWSKQADGSFISDDDYKAIPNESGFSLHRLDEDGNTGIQVAEVSTWADVQIAAESDSDDYDKFKESIGIKDSVDEETRVGIQQARAAREERKATLPSSDEDKDESLIPDNVDKSGELPNGVTYSLSDEKLNLQVFPGRYADVDGVRVTLDGETYNNKENIKRLGFKWNNADKVWYKNYLDSDLLGKDKNISRIREELEGIGGGKMPRYRGDNNKDIATIQEANNLLFKLLDENGLSKTEIQPNVRAAMDKLLAAQKDLQSENDNDREMARKKLNEFLEDTDKEDFPKGNSLEKSKTNVQQAIESLSEKIGDIDMPSNDDELEKLADNLNKGVKTPTKTVSKKSDTTPELFKEFDVPRGAFQLRTVEYEPEGYIDQESKNYTDDPNILSKRYPLPILVRAFTEALIGKKDEDILDEIVDVNLGDDDESLDLEKLNEVVNTPAPQAGRAGGTGAGVLEFNAGEEFVPAEALYNAVYLAGGDPNRVIANAYDAVHGDRRNLEKLTQASGELPSPEEQQLVDDIMKEIQQIKDSTPNGESPVSNIVQQPENDPLPGRILNNIPINWNNPDFYVMDPNPYVPSVPEQDENRYSDNPEFIARNFEESDLIQQLTTSITDGSGSSYLDYGDQGEYMEGIFEVPAEAIRDALQLLDVNTNTLLEDINAQANEPTPDAVEPERIRTPEEQQAPRFAGRAVEALKARYSENEIRSDIKLVAYLPADESIAFKDAWDEMYIARGDGRIFPLNVSEDWLTDPKGAGQAGWRTLTDAEKRDILGISQPEPEPAPAPQAEAAPTPTPTFQYPGPREPGYSANNTTMVRNGSIIGKGSRVVATKDGKAGTVVAIQNNPEYVRIRFDDGTTQVRAASKVKAISDPSGVAPRVAVQEQPKAAQGLERRLDTPTLPAPRLARSGDTPGVNDESTVPDWLAGLTNETAVQRDFSAWGLRDAEIAKAARERITLENLQKELNTLSADLRSPDNAKRRNAESRVAQIMGDVYGARSGITFGGEFYSINVTGTKVLQFSNVADFAPVTQEDAEKDRINYNVSTTMEIRNASGNKVGDIRRELVIKKKLDENKNVVGTDIYVKNDYLGIYGGGKKKGFATAFNRYSENWYIANGIEKVKVYAAGGENYQGGFVWALNGFGWEDKNPGVSIRDFKRAVKTREEEAQVEYLERKIQESKKADGTYDLSIFPTPLEFALVGWHPGAKDWIGKRVMIRESWNGVKNLKPEAREQVQAYNYTQIKNAERRVDSNQNIPSLSTNIQTLVESDKFRNNKTIAPYYSEIRDVLKNSRSLAVLQPSAKTALNAYISEELLNKERNIQLEDIFSLRKALGDEYKADYGYLDPFNSAEVLSEFTIEDFVSASRYNQDDTAIKNAGFTVKQIDGGVNSTFEVTHIESGQVFYVKNERFATQFSDSPGGVTELEAVTILRASGMQGVHDVRVGKEDSNIVIMSRAGAGIPLHAEAVTASDAYRRGLKKGQEKIDVSRGESILGILDTPEDVVRMSIFDILGNNEDRHGGNWMMAVDKVTGKVRLFPVDNTIGILDTNATEMIEHIDNGSFSENGVYQQNIPNLIVALGTDGMLKLYDNEIKKIITNLDNPLYQPKGFEMDAIIAKWGSYDAFKDTISSRLKKLITKGTDEYDSLKSALQLGYW